MENINNFWLNLHIRASWHRTNLLPLRLYICWNTLPLWDASQSLQTSLLLRTNRSSMVKNRGLFDFSSVVKLANSTWSWKTLELSTNWQGFPKKTGLSYFIMDRRETYFNRNTMKIFIQSSKEKETTTQTCNLTYFY